jgi:hypothetical protein
MVCLVGGGIPYAKHNTTSSDGDAGASALGSHPAPADEDVLDEREFAYEVDLAGAHGAVVGDDVEREQEGVGPLVLDLPELALEGDDVGGVPEADGEGAVLRIIRMSRV